MRYFKALHKLAELCWLRRLFIWDSNDKQVSRFGTYDFVTNEADEFSYHHEQVFRMTMILKNAFISFFLLLSTNNSFHVDFLHLWTCVLFKIWIYDKSNDCTSQTLKAAFKNLFVVTINAGTYQKKLLKMTICLRTPCGFVASHVWD